MEPYLFCFKETTAKAYLLLCRIEFPGNFAAISGPFPA